MFISELELKKNLLYNAAGSVFLALFGAVYELFSHEVYSYYMIYAFSIPLILGVFVYSIMLIKNKRPRSIFPKLWNSATATLSVGCVFKGVLDIYGTTNSLIIAYPIAGSALLLAGAISAAASPKKKKANRKND